MLRIVHCFRRSTDVVHKSRSISLDETQKYASVVAEFSALNGATVCKDADLTADSKSPSAVCTIADIEEDSDLKEHCGIKIYQFAYFHSNDLSAIFRVSTAHIETFNGCVIFFVRRWCPFGWF